MLSFLNSTIRRLCVPLAILYFLITAWNEPIKRKLKKINTEKSWRKTKQYISLANWCAGINIKTINGPTKAKNVVYVCNHGSIMDGTVVAQACGPQIRAILAGDEWYVKIPFFKSAINNAEHVLVDRGNIQKSLRALSKLKDQAIKKHPVLVFPEGIVTNRSKGEVVNKFKQGAFSLANELQIPIVPIASTGLVERFPELITIKMFFQSNSEATINFMQPYTEHLKRKMTNQEISEEIRKIIASEIQKAEC